MRIVHWDEMFHPSFGYQINILPVYQAKQGHEVTIVSSEKIDKHPTFSAFANVTDIAEGDRLFTERTGVRVIRMPIYGVYSGRVLYKPGYIRMLNELRADVIMCHTSDTLSAMTIIKKHRKINAPIVFDNHMLEMASRNKLSHLFRKYYSWFVTPILKKNQYITIRTQDDPYVMKCLGIPEKLVPFVSFGTDTDLFCQVCEREKNKLRVDLGVDKDAFVLLYAGKMDEAKGALLLAEALKDRFNTKKETVAILVGNVPKDAYGARVEDALSKSSNKIVRFPTQNYRDLVKFYQASDLVIFAKQCSLSYFDVQSCGIPVILEDNQVNIDRVQVNNGYAFKAGSVEDLRAKIEMCINMPRDKYDAMKEASRNNIMANYDYNKIAQEYTDILIAEKQRQEKEFSWIR